MSAKALNEVALIIWSGLLGAMKADGLIANCVQTTGPNTTKYLAMLAMDNVMKEPGLVWIPVAIAPNPKCEVFCIDVNNPSWPGDLLTFDTTWSIWLTRDKRIVQNVTHYLVIPPRTSAKDVV